MECANKYTRTTEFISNKQTKKVVEKVFKQKSTIQFIYTYCIFMFKNILHEILFITNYIKTYNMVGLKESELDCGLVYCYKHVTIGGKLSSFVISDLI